MFSVGYAVRVHTSVPCVLFQKLLYLSEILNDRLNEFKIIIMWDRLNYLNGISPYLFIHKDNFTMCTVVPYYKNFRVKLYG